MGGYREGQGCASYAFVIFSRVIGRIVEEEVSLIWLFQRGDVFEGIFDVDAGGEAHCRTSNGLKCDGETY